jgi:hypothetical protein
LRSLLALSLLCSALVGCELIADFDRSKIPDVAPGADAGMDAARPQPDAGPEPDEDAGAEDDAG